MCDTIYLSTEVKRLTCLRTKNAAKLVDSLKRFEDKDYGNISKGYAVMNSESYKFKQGNVIGKYSFEDCCDFLIIYNFEHDCIKIMLVNEF
jgi:hypothetical protein